MKSKMIIFLSAIFAIACSGPETAIESIKEAVKQKDMDGLTKAIDLHQYAVELYGEDAISSPFGQQMVRAAEETFRKWIETGELDREDNEDLTRAIDRLNFAGVDIEGLSVEDIKVEGKVSTAKIQLFIPRYDTVISRDANFRKTEYGWQLFKVSGLGDLGEEIERLEEKYNKKRNAEILSYDFKVSKVLSWTRPEGGALANIEIEVVCKKPVERFKANYYKQDMPDYWKRFYEEHFNVKSVRQKDPTHWIVTIKNEFYMNEDKNIKINMIVDEVVNQQGQTLVREPMWR